MLVDLDTALERTETEGVWLIQRTSKSLARSAAMQNGIHAGIDRLYFYSLVVLQTSAHGYIANCSIIKATTEEHFHI